MEAKNTTRFARVSHPFGNLSRLSRRSSRLLLVGWCFLFALSPLHWGMSDDWRDSASTSPRQRIGSPVLAFQYYKSFAQMRRHVDLSKQRLSPLPPPSVETSPLFFSNKDIDVGISSNTRKSDHTRKYLLQNIDNRNSCSPLFSNNDGEGGPSNDKSNGESSKKPSMKRVGGRRRQQQPKEYIVIKEPKENKFPSAGSLVVGLLLLTLLKNMFFVGDAENYSYYSYSSYTVYETRVNPDGRPETFRKQSSDLKTNIPGLTGADFVDRSNNRGSVTTSYFYFEE